MSEKIKAHHLNRKAVLYVRQSSPFQVSHNEESRRLQYAMEQRIRNLGWQAVSVIDEDLGRSASGDVERIGFQRMVAEVCLGRVGVVAAREVSRFARNSKDWQQLIEVCRMVDTLLLDQEVVYDSRNSNDRLLLGLKGSLNEYELDLLRQRSQEARRQKASRGELVVAAPVGYIKTADQRLEKDPDQRVQQAIQLIYRKFFELGTVRQTLLWWVEQGLDLPVTRHTASGWETAWKRPCYSAVLNILRDPVYAGAYRYGRSAIRSVIRDGRPKKVIVQKPINEWSVLIPNRHEGYITWDEFERVSHVITNNSQKCFTSSSGAPMKGLALLAGLLRCRKCGRKLMVSYTGRQHDKVRYLCRRGALDQGEPKCISFGGTSVDEAIAREVLRVVEPGAIEAAVRAAQHQTGKQDDLLRALGLELQSTRYQADRARRQYDLVDPENRLVTEELERRWNAALAKVREIEMRIEEAQNHRNQMTQPRPELFQSLDADLRVVWNDPKTDPRLKKRIVRTLLEEVIADVDSKAGEIALVLHWKGDTHTELCIRRRRRGQSSSDTPIETINVVRILASICADNWIAAFLNRNGLCTGPGNRWTRERVVSLRNYHGIPVYSEQRRRSEGWMNLGEAASHLNVASKTLRLAAERGDVPSLHPLGDGPWVFKRTDLDLPTIRERIKSPSQERLSFAGQNPGQLKLDLAKT
jgi:DNA invertase Pin-like site-specific DNA recombinase